MTRCDPLLVARIGYAVLADLPVQPARGHVVLVTSTQSGGAHLVSTFLVREMASRLAGEVALVDAATPVSAAPADPIGVDGLSCLLANPGVDTAKVALADETGVFRVAPGADLRQESFFRTEAVAGALDALRARFKFTVIQGPVLETCGALIGQADKVLLAIDAQATSPRSIRRSMARAGVTQGEIGGVVLTNAPDNMPSWLAGE